MLDSHPRLLWRAGSVATLVGGILASALVVAAPAQAQRITPEFWGMHDNDWTSAPDVPVGSANLTTSGTYWRNIETTPGHYTWARLDEQVAAAEGRGAQPMIVLGVTPTFHSSTPLDPADPKTHVPNPLAWELYVAAVVDRYGTRLDYQIWPEPNIVQNWSGSPAEMAELTMRAADVIHGEAPDAKVVSPAVALRLKGQRAWFARYLKEEPGGKGVHTYVDAIALDPFPLEAGTPEDSYALIEGARQQLARNEVRKPIWSNEINYGVAGAGQPTDVRYTDPQARSLVIRTYVLSAAARVQRTYWLGWFRSDTLGVQMTDTYGARAAAGEAYVVVRSWMNGTSFQGCRTTTRGKAKGLHTCTMRKSRHEVRRVYWTTGRAVKIRTHPTSRAWEGQTGVRRTRKGPFKLKVTSQPVMVVSRR